MRELLHDIADDPHEYLPVFLFAAGLLAVWGGLSVTAIFSLRGTLRHGMSVPRRGLWLALIPLGLGFLGVWAQIPFSMENGDFQLSFDCRWLFLLPMLLGATALAFWWRARPRPGRAV